MPAVSLLSSALLRYAKAGNAILQGTHPSARAALVGSVLSLEVRRARVVHGLGGSDRGGGARLGPEADGRVVVLLVAAALGQVRPALHLRLLRVRHLPLPPVRLHHLGRRGGTSQQV